MQLGPARETVGHSTQRLSLLLPWRPPDVAEKRIISYLAVSVSDRDGASILTEALRKTEE